MMEETESKNEETEFKKPVLFGRIGKLPKKVKNDSEKNTEEKNVRKPIEIKSDFDSRNSLPPAALLKELSTPIPYKEPKWSGICPDGSDYALEVLKSGMIVEKIELTTKPYFVFGRLSNCDIVMAHPTISRHHAVLQYKAFAEEGEPASGWYLYDLDSTHGTFLNREQLKSSHYTRVRVGHQIKFGNSTRTYILLGPDFDAEGESELTVTEIKKRAEVMKAERNRMIREDADERERNRLEEEKKREEQGIDWGMGEDAEEETDLAENPYASTGNEELYLDDPKKTLRGYFEREGYELSYDCEEKGVGQFVCRVELPIDDARGRPLKAEVIHRGKKKEAVIACALEACRILDRTGLLRQAKHESRRRKERDWSADDYYDSDEDTFLDRTGSVERKRRIRMEKLGAVETKNEKPLTYDDLLKQISDVEGKIANEERVLERLRDAVKTAAEGGGNGDALDEYMSTLKHGTMAQKADISRTKMNIQKLKGELNKTQRLAELARPAHLPPLLKESKPPVRVGNNSVVYGKRIRLKDEKQKKPEVKHQKKQEETDFVEEVESDEETESSPRRRSERDGDIDTGNLLESEMDTNMEKREESPRVEEQEESTEEGKRNENSTRVFGPMRPPEDYVAPEGYFDQISDRDLPEIQEKE